jgi:hypothetical protein
MEKLLEELNNCDRMLLWLKFHYQPMYSNLLIFWRERRKELKSEISMCLSRKLAIKLLTGGLHELQA